MATQDEIREYPPPRSVRRRAGRGCFIDGRHFVSLPIFCWGMVVFVVAVWYTVIALSIDLFGKVVPGKITEQHRGRGMHGRSFVLKFSYQVGSTTYGDSCFVSPSAYDQHPERTPVHVRILPALPSANPQLIGAGAADPWTTVGTMWIGALVPSAIVLMIVWKFYVEPWLLRKLVITGVPTFGTIVQKKIKRGTTKTFVLHYEYKVPGMVADGMETGASEMRTSSMKVRHEEYQAAKKGSTELVLYDPNRPQRSLLYRFADYEAIGG